MKKLILPFLTILPFTTAPLALAKTPAKPQHLVSEADAKTTALHEYSGVIKSSELEYEGGRWIYSFDIADATGNGSIHEVQIAAETGKLVSTHIESATDEKGEQAAENAEQK